MAIINYKHFQEDFIYENKFKEIPDILTRIINLEEYEKEELKLLQEFNKEYPEVTKLWGFNFKGV